jgi:hypothetical protein
VAEALKQLAPDTQIEVWFQDEMRLGQKNSLVYQWAKKGTRPRQPKDQRYANAYVFGAVCPSRDTGVALIMPNADTEAMQMHIDAIGRAIPSGAHALIILDKAGWHTTRRLEIPDNLTLVPLPPACPELNAAENIWQYLRQTYLANRVFESYAAILDAAQSAWCKLLDEGGRRALVHGGHYFEGEAEARIEGSTVGGALLWAGWIGEGLCLELAVQGKRVSTSRVRSIAITTAPGPS